MKITSRRRHVIAIALVIGALALSFVASHVQAEPQQQVAALKLVPADSLVVIRVNNLAATSKKVADLSQKLGLAMLSPELADPLGSMKRQMNITKGLKEDGEMLISILAPADDAGAAAAPAADAAAPTDNQAEGNDAAGDDDDAADADDDDPQVIVLVPVTDYKEFLGNFPDAKTAGPLTITTTPNGDDIYIADATGGFAAIAPTRTILTRKPKLGVKALGIAAAQFAQHDFAAYANMPAIKKIALPKLQAERANIIARFEKEMEAATPEKQKYVPALRVMLNQALDGAEQFLTDAEAGSWGLTISDTGISGTTLAQFGAASPIGSRVVKVRNSDSNMLAGLGQMPYLVFGGTALNPEGTAQILDDMTAPALAELEKIEEAAPIVTWINALKDFQKAQTSQAFGAASPTAALGQGSMFQVIGVATGDAKKMQAAQKQMFETQKEAMKLFGTKNAEVTTTYTAKAKEVDGVTFDEMKTQFNFDPKTPQEHQAQQLITWMYGPDGMSGYVATLDDQKLLSVVGGDDALIKKAIVAAKKGDAPLASLPVVKQVAAKLPQNRVAVVYVPLDEIAKTGLNYARQAGFPAKVQIPPNLPPIGVTVGTDGSAVRIDSFVPTQLIQSLVAAGMQGFMQMQQGAPGGGL